MASSSRSSIVSRGVDVSQILSGIREALGADTAVVLLVDASGSVLEPVAASGLDITLRAGARVPVGQGFAGSIAASGRPRQLDEVTDTNVINPMLRRSGVVSLLGVPLTTEDQVMGVLHVGSLTPREFTPDDVSLLTELAHDLSAWLVGQASAEHHTAALVLQRSLIPTIPQSIPGLDLAGRYVPAEGDLGGDWYDVFDLPDGRVGFVMGDVLGHGLQPAVVMGRIRSALRAYALIEESPARVLELLDQKITHFEAGTLATVLFAVARPPFDTFVMSSAGHWPPLIADGAGPAVQVELETGPMLGLAPGSSHADVSVPVPLGAALCLFTDGLIEHRPTPDAAIDPDWGMRAVEEQFSGDRTAEASCIAILGDVLPEHGGQDDVALLVVRRA